MYICLHTNLQGQGHWCRSYNVVICKIHTWVLFSLLKKECLQVNKGYTVIMNQGHVSRFKVKVHVTGDFCKILIKGFRVKNTNIFHRVLQIIDFWKRQNTCSLYMIRTTTVANTFQDIEWFFSNPFGFFFSWVFELLYEKKNWWYFKVDYFIFQGF